MKKKMLYILLLSVLCFGIQAQAQEIGITDYTTKQQSLDSTSAASLSKLIASAYGLYVDANANAAAYPINLRAAKKMSIENSNDWQIIITAYPQSLHTIELIDIVWDGTTEFAIPDGSIENMPNLNYVYIRSQSALSRSLINSSFRELIEQITPEAGIEILFHTMEEPK